VKLLNSHSCWLDILSLHQINSLVCSMSVSSISGGYHDWCCTCCGRVLYHWEKQGPTDHFHWIEWLQFFSKFFKPLPGITAYHHYKVSKKEPGIVTVKEYANSPEEKFNIFKKGVTASLLQGRNLHLSFWKVWTLSVNGICMVKSDHFALQTLPKTLLAQNLLFSGLMLL